MTDLMGGQIPMLFSSLAPVVGAVRQGRVRPLAVTTLTRSAAFPDVPTMDEAGYKGFDATAWFGLVGPAGLSPEVVSRIAQSLQKASEDRTMREQHNANGCDSNILTPAQTTEKVKADYAKWGKVIRDANIKPD
jgi:tripartite-type tricarboxylate transporter receptor subunit TctC